MLFCANNLRHSEEDRKLEEKRPRFSIVIPVYNEEKNLPECLESLLAQDFSGSYEIIVVDNLSTDRSAEIARKYGIKTLRCNRKGTFFARETGALAARGEIIAQADADTVYPKDWLTRFNRQFTEHKEAVAVGGPFLYKTPPWWWWAERCLRYCINIIALLLLGRPFVISGANFAFRKLAFFQINGYDTHAYGADQFDLATRLSRVGRVIYDDKNRIRTSSRTMEKPVFYVYLDLWIHVGKYLRYELKAPAEYIRSLPVRLRLSTGRVIVTGLIVIPVSFCAYGYFIPASPVFGKIYYRGDSTRKVVALTFDDGPNEPYTSQVLDVLDENGIKGTFFMTGYNVEKYPETAGRVVKEGHVLGNHSYRHDANHALSMEGCYDMTLADERIFAVTGVHPALYRPPHGRKSPWELDYVNKNGLTAVNWSIATTELAGLTPEQMAADIVSKTRPGGIILLHDGYGLEHDTAKADKSATAEMLPLIIKELRAQGYEFVTVSDLIDVAPYRE